MSKFKSWKDVKKEIEGNLTQDDLDEIKLEEEIIKATIEVRKSAKLTQQELSDRCNLYQSTYNHYENGYSLIKIMPAYSICKTYNVSMDWLVGRTINKNIEK